MNKRVKNILITSAIVSFLCIILFVPAYFTAQKKLKNNETINSFENFCHTNTPYIGIAIVAFWGSLGFLKLLHVMDQQNEAFLDTTNIQDPILKRTLDDIRGASPYNNSTNSNDYTIHPLID